MIDQLQQRLGLRTNPRVFIVSAVLILGFVVFGAIFTDAAARLFETIQTFITGQLGWFYILVVNVLLVFCLWVGFSRYGSIRLGPETRVPSTAIYRGSRCCSVPAWASECCSGRSPNRCHTT